MNKPTRRAVCAKVRALIDAENMESLVDNVILQYALDLQKWHTPQDDEE